MDGLDSLLLWGTSCTWVLAIHDLCLWLVMLPAAHTPPGSTLRYARRSAGRIRDTQVGSMRFQTLFLWPAFWL